MNRDKTDGGGKDKITYEPADKHSDIIT